jgi:hypothetical protein
MRGGVVTQLPSVSNPPQGYICSPILVSGQDIVVATAAATATLAGTQVAVNNYNLSINGRQVNDGPAAAAAAGAVAGKDYTLYLINGKLYAVDYAKLPISDVSHITVHTV